jgi:beta-lactamase regulating signal transducer with metallopeptidase domain/biopolymer transport protein ExbD
MIEALNGYGRVWAEYFAWAVAQNTLFLGLVFLVLYMLRNASARVKYAVAAVGLVKVLLPPFVPTSVLAPAAGQSIQETTSTLLFSFTNTPVNAVVPAKAFPIGLNEFGAVFMIWVGAALIILAHSIVVTVRLARSVGDAVLVDDVEVPRVAKDRRIQVYKSDQIGMPLTIGIFSRRVYVPEAWDGWTPDCRRVVLKHEMAHISRYDGLFQFLELVAQAVYFFHPLVLILNRRLREYREMACDDASVGVERASRLDYSRFLLELAETALRPPVVCESASALMRRKNELFKRVAYQVKEGNMHFVSKKKMAVLLAAMLLAVVPFSLYLGGGGDEAVAGKKESASREASFDIVLKGDVVYCCGEKVNQKGLDNMLAKIAQEKGDDAVFHIDCKGDVPMASLYEVQRSLLDANLTKVSYANGDGKILKIMLPTDKMMKKLEQVAAEDMANIYIGGDGECYLDKQHVKLGKLTKHVEKRLDENPKVIFLIHTKDKTTYENFVMALTQVKMAGADKVIVNTPS